MSLRPSGAAIGGFEDAAVGAAEGAVLIEALLLLPEGGIDDVGVLGIDADVVAAGVVVLESTFSKLAPPSVERKMPRSGLGP